MKSVLVLEDAPDVRAWLVELVGTAFVEATVTEAGTLAQALSAIGQQAFDLALIDINLPDGNGLSLLQALRARTPATYCVMATIFDDDENIFHALQAGAQGYLLKQEPRERLLEGLQGILAGEPPLSPHVARRILTHFRKAAAPSPVDDYGLSPREREILTLIAKGLNRAEIGKMLGISPATVATHIGAVYRKLDVSSRSEATVEAIRMGLMRP
jgi:DNA-binding NarL/FixJ family response regulator